MEHSNDLSEKALPHNCRPQKKQIQTTQPSEIVQQTSLENEFGSDFSESCSDSDFEGDESSTTEQSEENEGDADNWQDWKESEDDLEIQSLFSSKIFQTAKEVWVEAKECYGFDFYQTTVDLALDFYGCIRLVNYIRQKIKNGLSPSACIDTIHSKSSTWINSDLYLKPILEDDALLFSLDDFVENMKSNAVPSTDANVKDRNTCLDSMDRQELISKIQILQEDVKDLRCKMKEYAPKFLKLATTRPISKSTVIDDTKNNQAEKSPDKIISSSGLTITDDDYFGGYSTRHIHELMLKDKVRTEAYQNAIYNNPQIFKDKVVLDVGCGTGILCFFAAKAGAKRVIGIDRADIIDKAKLIAKANKLNHIITFIKEKVEDATLPVKTVDIIISEWMGYFLLYESMLPSVLYARDKWLSKSGHVLPQKAIMFLAGIENSSYRTDKVEFWKDVYGFDMSCLIDDQERYVGSLVDIINPESIITTTHTMLTLDIEHCSTDDVDFVCNFELTALRDDTLNGFVSWFDVVFEGKENITLSTSPSSPKGSTHWQQTIFYLFKPLQLKKGDKVTGSLKAYRNKSCARDYSMSISYALEGTKPLIQEFVLK